jgi:hypothetical protein
VIFVVEFSFFGDGGDGDVNGNGHEL